MRDYSWSDLERMGLLCVIYVSTAALGLSLDAAHGIATMVWPPTGIALAALTLYGMRLWPGIAAGALLVNSWAGAPTFAASGVAVGNTLEALLGASSCGVWSDSVQPWIGCGMSLDSSSWRRV